MITSLTELSNAITCTANIIVQTACNQIKDGSFQIAVDDMGESGFSKEDLRRYEDFLVAELAARPEFETLSYHDGVFSCECKREYCPNLKDRRPEEPVLPVSRPLSMSELSEIGSKAILALNCSSLAGLRDILGINYMQALQLGLTHQPHYFTVERPDEEEPFWTENIDTAVHNMRRQCEAGIQAKMFYNEISEDNQTLRIPLAKQSCYQIASITLPVEDRPKNPGYAEAVQKVEAATYKLPWNYSLSYHITGLQIDERNPLTLQDAIHQFSEAAQISPNPILTVRLKTPDSSMRSEAVILSSERGRTHMNTFSLPESSFQPRRGNFYTNLALMAFPDRVLDIDRWRIRVVEPGERYGRGFSMINEGNRSLVEFRDMDGASSLSPDGILVCVRPMDVMLGREQWGGDASTEQRLCLYDNVESWTISSGQIIPIRTWLLQKESERHQAKENGLDQKIHIAQGRANSNQQETDSRQLQQLER